MPTFYYFRNDIISEPLINQWYASIVLLPPHSYARFLTQRLIPILQSYLNAPSLHLEASRQKSLSGGLFVNLEFSQFEYAKTLMEKLLFECHDLIQLSKEIEKLYYLINTKAKEIYSFENYYQIIPEPLKGFVELNYDESNYPKIKFFEPLLYKSNYYRSKFQSILIHKKDPDMRTFNLSTPRLNLGNDLQINLPFRSKFYDQIYSSREKGLTQNKLEKLYQQIENKTFNFKRFKNFFLSEFIPSNLQSNPKNKSINLKYFGHACVLIEIGSTNILIDPLISTNTDKDNVPRFTFVDLPDELHFVLLTHAHLDHANLETLIQIRYKIGVIVVPQNSTGSIFDPSLALFLKACGFKKIISIEEFQNINFKAGEIIGIPFMGEHGNLAVQSKMSYVIKTKARSIGFFADSNNLSPELYTQVANHLNFNIDIIFLGMECEGAPVNWLYGPVLMKKLSKQQNHARRLNGSNCERAISLLKIFRCKRAYIYAMGDEPWLNFISSINFNKQSKQNQEANKLIEIGKQNHISVERLYGSQELK